MADWLNPLNRIEIQKAVRNRATNCTINNGRTRVGIDYINSNTVWIQPVRGGVPCGYFKIDTILDERWTVTKD